MSAVGQEWVLIELHPSFHLHPLFLPLRSSLFIRTPETPTLSRNRNTDPIPFPSRRVRLFHILIPAQKLIHRNIIRRHNIAHCVFAAIPHKLELSAVAHNWPILFISPDLRICSPGRARYTYGMIGTGTASELSTVPAGFCTGPTNLYHGVSIQTGT